MSLTTRRVCGKYSADTNMFDSRKGMCKPIGRIYVPFALTNVTANTDCIPLLSLHSAWQTQCREPWSPTLSMYRTENSFPVLTPHKIMDLTRMSITFLALVTFPAQTMLCWGTQSPLWITSEYLFLKPSALVT